MPTGYTAPISEGKQLTFREFVLRCSRAFGALIHLRDDRLEGTVPDLPEPSSWYQERLKEAEKDLRVLNTMSAQALEYAADVEYRAEYDRWVAGKTEKERTYQDYEKLIQETLTWTPPTEEHEGLKTFMLEQLRESQNWDCNIYPAPKKLTGEEWEAKQRAHYLRDITYYQAEHQKELDRIQERRDWITRLVSSLPKE
jgi:hypothetical protein